MVRKSTPQQAEPESSSSTAAVTVRKHGEHISIVTINNPLSLNSITPEVAVRLAEAWDACNRDGDCRVVVITGSGARSFCSGADLKQLITLMTGSRQPAAGNQWDKAVVEDPRLASRGMLREPVLERPLIAAINGSAIAGGMEMVLAADIRVAAEHALFGFTQPKLGLFPSGVTARLPRQVPFCHAMELLMTGNLVSAQRAMEMGFVNYVVPTEGVLPMALQIAEAIAANSPAAVKAIRESIKSCLSIADEEEAARRETDFSQPVFDGPDAKEGPRAFLEKRRPRWSKL